MSNFECNPNDLFEAGAIFLFFDVPPNTEFGIDYNCWRTGENFKGVKMIPPGIHFVYFNVTDKYGTIGLRNGFFHDFKFKEIVARKWNKQSESIDENHVYTDSELEVFDLNKKELDRFLGAYPFEEYKRWKSLTNDINAQFLAKLIPENKIISSGSSLIGNSFLSTNKKNNVDGANLSNKDELKVNTDLLRTPSSLQEAEKMIPEMKNDEKQMIHFSQMPTEMYPAGSTPSQITKYLIDQSYRFEQLINKVYQDPINVLCELQFAFACFLIGQVYDGFEQWKFIINLLCNSEEAILKHTSIFVKFIQIIYFQLKEMPEDFFTDVVTKNNFLAVNLHNLFDNVKHSCESISSNNRNKELINLNEKCEQFKSYLQEKFSIDFDMEPDEYAPVVCEQGDEN